MTGFAGWLTWNYCSSIEVGVYARYTNNYGRSDVIASGEFFDLKVKNRYDEDDKLTGVTLKQYSDTVCDEGSGEKLSLKHVVLCDRNIKNSLSESDFTTSYENCQYKVKTTHASGCPMLSAEEEAKAKAKADAEAKAKADAEAKAKAKAEAEAEAKAKADA